MTSTDGRLELKLHNETNLFRCGQLLCFSLESTADHECIADQLKFMAWILTGILNQEVWRSCRTP